MSKNSSNFPVFWVKFPDFSPTGFPVHVGTMLHIARFLHCFFWNFTIECCLCMISRRACSWCLSLSLVSGPLKLRIPSDRQVLQLRTSSLVKVTCPQIIAAVLPNTLKHKQFYLDRTFLIFWITLPADLKKNRDLKKKLVQR